MARALAGFWGANISTAMAYISDVTGEKDRSKNMGLIGAAFGLGFILGPAIGGLTGGLGSQLGDGPPFNESFPAVIAGVISLLNCVFAVIFLKESLPKATQKKAEKRSSHWELLSKYVRPDLLGKVFVVSFLTIFAMAHMEASLFMYVSDKFQWSMVTASFGFAYVGLIMAFTQGFLIRKLLPLLGERKILLIGFALFIVGMIFIGLSSQVWTLGVSVTLMSFGNALIFPTLIGTLSLLSDSSEQGTVMGVNQSLAALGRILGPALGGWVYGNLGWSSPFYVAGGLGFLGLLIVLKIFRQLPHAGEVRH